MKYLTDRYDGYLTDKAREAIHELKETGVDKDLAFAILEQLWDEDEIYELDS